MTNKSSDAKTYIDSIFAGYEKTAALADFKEELLSNLNDKIADLIKRGASEDEAFEKATKDLDDISAIADEISLKKKQEVLADAFMDIRHYMTPRRVAGYVSFGATLLFGIIIAVVVYFGIAQNSLFEEEFFGDVFFDGGVWVSVFGSLMPFASIAIAGFTFLGVTQEFYDRYPVIGKRAVWYAIAAGLISFGIFLFPTVYFASSAFFGDTNGLLAAIASSFIPFLIPGAAILAYQILTERDLRKPWAKPNPADFAANFTAMYKDPVVATKFGMYSGAIWMLAVAAFFLCGFLLDGFVYSWVSFIVAAAIQSIVQANMIKKGEKNEKSDEESDEKLAAE